jgi:hypothetical protein
MLWLYEGDADLFEMTNKRAVGMRAHDATELYVGD